MDSVQPNYSAENEKPHTTQDKTNCKQKGCLDSFWLQRVYDGHAIEKWGVVHT